MPESDSTRGRITAWVLCALMLAFGGTAGGVAAEPLGTLKERLSDKASDNQRVDNCHVPMERRGPKPRPDCKPASGQAPQRSRPSLRIAKPPLCAYNCPDPHRFHSPAHDEGPA